MASGSALIRTTPETRQTQRNLPNSQPNQSLSLLEKTITSKSTAMVGRQLLPELRPICWLVVRYLLQIPTTEIDPNRLY
jgi:hypothetical protein